MTTVDELRLDLEAREVDESIIEYQQMEISKVIARTLIELLAEMKEVNNTLDAIKQTVVTL